MDEHLEIPGTRSPTCSRRSLERLCAGELAGEDEQRLRAHAASCPECARALADLAREAEAFHREVAFDRFEAAVAAKAQKRSRRHIAGPVGLALVAGLAALLFIRPLTALHSRPGIKGDGASVLELFVGCAGQAPRIAQNNETLAPGERVRVGYQSAHRRFVLVFSIDEAGVATALYPESGPSLPAEQGPGTHLMPDSLELTGRGAERIVALLSDEPIDARAALAAASREFSRAGRLDRMGPMRLGAEELSVVLHKPDT